MIFYFFNNVLWFSVYKSCSSFAKFFLKYSFLCYYEWNFFLSFIFGLFIVVYRSSIDLFCVLILYFFNLGDLINSISFRFFLVFCVQVYLVSILWFLFHKLFLLIIISIIWKTLEFRLIENSYSHALSGRYTDYLSYFKMPCIWQIILV